ncbi:MAG TPA: ABC transporter transmembrane domain-containing protein [Brevefilum sp.]|nr:ABC transporter transmembrane domain-containing protein [Brevefilum sp.]HOR19608.1 ABC transporter transmembrane domain-containing protein [Brevefilum sp.]HPL70245.1 ABC transporter transmembrane domain-containing protein [Brevefilum sp.]
MSDFKSILKPILPLRIIAFIFQIISIGLSLAQPVFIGLLIDKINLLATPDHFQEITQLTIMLIGVSILDLIVYYLKDRFSKALYDGINLMRDHVLSLALNQPISIFESNNIGDKLNKILNDSELYAKYKVYQVPSTAIILIRIIAIYIILFNMNPALTGLLVVIFSIYVIIYLGINKKIRPLIGEELADYSNVMSEEKSKELVLLVQCTECQHY